MGTLMNLQHTLQTRRFCFLCSTLIYISSFLFFKQKVKSRTLPTCALCLFAFILCCLPSLSSAYSSLSASSASFPSIIYSVLIVLYHITPTNYICRAYVESMCQCILCTCARVVCVCVCVCSGPLGIGAGLLAYYPHMISRLTLRNPTSINSLI